MKIYVTGPHGFVGARIMAECAEAIPAPSLRECRECNEDSIKRMIDAIQPDVIIHTAAISDISVCKRNPEASYHVNVEIPIWLAKTGVKLIAFSSDQVYSDCDGDGPYSEGRVAPANLYAKHKYEMEESTLDSNPNTVLLRATWMYDMPMYGVVNRGNFLINMLRSKNIAFPSRQYRGVTYVREVARNIKKAIHLPGGVYNYGSENDLNMIETAQWLKKELNLDVNIEESVPRHNLWMDCTKIKKHDICFNSTVDGLKQCINDYNIQ